jgi:RP/EB family microtubule-associated protein
LKTLEELASGAVFCQILDLIYDGMVPLQKVHWNTDKQSDFAANFDVLVTSMRKFHVLREVPVERLISGEKVELASLLDWLKVFSLSNRNLGNNYDAISRRGGKEPNFNYVEKIKVRNQESDAVEKSMNKENLFSSQRPALHNFDAKTVQKLAQYDLMKSEKEFYYSKLRDIDQVLDAFKESSVETLIQTIRDIIYLPAEKVGIVTEDGHFVIKGDIESRFDEANNIAANFIGGAGDNELNDFNFNANIDLLAERMDMEHPKKN